MNKWIIALGIIVLLIIIFRKEIFANAKWGGIVYGRPHEQGGVKAYIKDRGEIIELEEKEVILNKTSMQMTEKFMCQGTPKEIASQLNELGGGVPFENNGICRRIS